MISHKQSIPASKLPYGATGLSEGETFITNISKVPAVEQMISESNFLSNSYSHFFSLSI